MNKNYHKSKDAGKKKTQDKAGEADVRSRKSRSGKKVADRRPGKDKIDGSFRDSERKFNARSCADNDWRWYAPSEQLVRDYASFPFGIPLGTQIDSGSSTAPSYSVPGIMALYYVPTIGYADSEISPINMAMRRFYAYVRRDNSGATNYDPADLMMYLLAVDGPITFLAYMKRMYGTMLTYSPTNRYYAKHVVQLMGGDYDSLASTLADFRGYINIYATKLKQLPIPASIAYNTRHEWMAENLYVDSSAAKAQTYMYVPVGYYKFIPPYDPTSESDAAYLQVVHPWSYTHGAPTAEMTLAKLQAFGDSLLQPLIVNQDFSTMAGDILKAYGEGGVYRASGVTDDYSVVPLYNAEVLSQIENATVFSECEHNIVTQTTNVGTGYLVSTPRVDFSLNTSEQIVIYKNGDLTTPYNATLDYSSWPTDNILTAIKEATPFMFAPRVMNMHHDAVKPEEVMVATRLMNFFSDNPNDVWKPTIDTGNDPNTPDTGYFFSCTSRTIGSEVIVAGIIGFFGTVTAEEMHQTPTFVTVRFNSFEPALTGGTFTVSGSSDLYYLSPSDSLQRVSSQAETIALLSNFDWHPVVFTGSYSLDGQLTSTSGEPLTIRVGSAEFSTSRIPLLDTDNYTVLNSDNLVRLAEVALLGEFSVDL